ncbi:DUF2510 domain-containing protein [Jiangella mangrovi]|uniref:DUF2510 domain-containing protein n=1 Tax=Jiangella mangrovi TaxID=1524084 RepID=A0A7W9LPZ7_9ACTN|nr:DUF2510 domain-containing protein [Jiangella mangrovi]MBB5791774.1 hypothetical protein [Jiangella mangrovi]
MTVGLVDFRSDKERVARSARLTKRAVKKQTRFIKAKSIAEWQEAKKQAKLDQAILDYELAEDDEPKLPPAGWFIDPQNPQFERWWDGQQWTHHLRKAP